MDKNGLLIVISGFSGVGKGTIVKALLDRYPDQYALSVSATSRAPRPGEEEGIAYFFRTREEFESLIQCGQLLEYAEYNGNYYGTPKAYVEEQLSAGKNVILEIEVQGALKIRDSFNSAFLIYILPPSGHELARRLRDRGTETAEVIRERLSRAILEAEYISRYDEIIVNDVLEDSILLTHETILKQQEKHNSLNRLIEEIKADLNEITKGE